MLNEDARWGCPIYMLKIPRCLIIGWHRRQDDDEEASEGRHGLLSRGLCRVRAAAPHEGNPGVRQAQRPK